MPTNSSRYPDDDNHRNHHHYHDNNHNPSSEQEHDNHHHNHPLSVSAGENPHHRHDRRRSEREETQPQREYLPPAASRKGRVLAAGVVLSVLLLASSCVGPGQAFPRNRRQFFTTCWGWGASCSLYGRSDAAVIAPSRPVQVPRVLPQRPRPASSAQTHRRLNPFEIGVRTSGRLPSPFTSTNWGAGTMGKRTIQDGGSGGPPYPRATGDGSAYSGRAYSGRAYSGRALGGGSVVDDGGRALRLRQHAAVLRSILGIGGGPNEQQRRRRP